MRNAFVVAGLFIGLLRAANVLAEAPRSQFDCDTPSGHYSQWKMTHVAEAARIRGTVKVLELRKEALWNPGAHVYLYSADGSLVVGLILALDKADQTKLQVSAIERGSRTLNEPFASVPWKDREITFQMETNGSAAIRMSVDGISHDIEVAGFAVSAVGLRCTSGNFLFTAVSVAP